MPRNPALQIEWEQRVKKFYQNLRDKKDNGAAKYTPEWCIKKTATEFLREPSTIEAIVYGAYDARRERLRLEKENEDKNQLKMFE